MLSLICNIVTVKSPAVNGKVIIGSQEEKQKLKDTEVNGDIDRVEQPPALRGLTFMVEKVGIYNSKKQKLKNTEVNGDIDRVEQPPAPMGLTFMVEKLGIYNR